ncbi:MAG: hypothetical protein PHT69_01720 [Bacteroidales bacterium]|nr:hypothetical protein [Bacteroidales bacterium]
MSDKKACQKPEHEESDKGKYTCKKCGIKAEKEKHLCKPKKSNK